MDHVHGILSHLPRDHHECAEAVVSANLFPLFVTVHYLLVATAHRSRGGSVEHARQHPFSSWFVCVTSCFAGRLCMHLLLGYPLVQIYESTNNLLLASAVWYLVFFSPLDIVHKLLSFKGVWALLLILKEVHRIHGIKNGVEIARGEFPSSYFIVVLCGTVRGSGAKLVLRPLDGFVRGTIATTTEFTKPAFSTKHSVVCAILLVLQHAGRLDIPQSSLILTLMVVAIVTQLSILFTSMRDAYENVGDIFCWLVFTLPRQTAGKIKEKKKQN